MKIAELKNEQYKEKGYKIFLKKQLYLFIAEMLSLRLNWIWSLVIVLVSPISILLFFYFFWGEDKVFLVYAVTGNMVMSLVTGTMLSLGQELGVLKQIKGFDYYATLPLRKINLIIAYIMRATCTTFPSLMVLYFFGKYLLNIDITLHISIIVVVLLSGFSLSALGACIGIYSRNAESASSLTQIIQPLLVYLAPVYVQIESLPFFLQIVSKIVPTTYVASALRASCKGIWDIESMLVLLLLSLISIILIEKRMEWRKK